jgi:hypothetical protein
MSNTPKTIYRRPEHAGNPPTKAVIRGETSMLTLDPARLAKAGSVYTAPRGWHTVKPVSRRPLSKAAVILFLLGVLVVVVVLIAITSERRAHAQIIGEPVCYISAPALPAMSCIEPRAYLPIVQR